MLNAFTMAALDRETPPAAVTECAAAARAVSYAINSSAMHLSPEARETLAAVAQYVGHILSTTREGDAGAPKDWRTLAALALQMEARALGIDHACAGGYPVGVLDALLPSSDNPLTPD